MAKKKLLILPAGDPERNRLVAIFNRNGQIEGAGCLVSPNSILTCQHVLNAASLNGKAQVGERFKVRLCAFDEPTDVFAKVAKPGDVNQLPKDLALLSFSLGGELKLAMTDTEFATPFRYGGKPFSVVGFPESREDGYYASGLLRGTNVSGVCQLDSDSEISITNGFSGSPVWSTELNAFVGLVVGGLAGRTVAHCIPSRMLARFFPRLSVKFRMTAADRPDVHDYDDDDPNRQLFGNVSETDTRRLSITRVKQYGHDDDGVDDEYSDDDYFEVHLKYECLKGSQSHGRFVTFVTHPSLSGEYEDAYELFSEVKAGVAKNYFITSGSFTVAAIGDAGDTVLATDMKNSRMWRNRDS